MKLEQSTDSSYFMNPYLNTGFGVGYLAIYVLWIKIRIDFDIDDDFMQYAKYWMSFGILLRAGLCLAFGLLSFLF